MHNPLPAQTSTCDAAQRAQRAAKHVAYSAHERSCMYRVHAQRDRCSTDEYIGTYGGDTQRAGYTVNTGYAAVEAHNAG